MVTGTKYDPQIVISYEDNQDADGPHDAYTKDDPEMINIESPANNTANQSIMTLQQQKESALSQWVNQSNNIGTAENSLILGYEGGIIVESSPERTVNNSMAYGVSKRPQTGNNRKARQQK